MSDQLHDARPDGEAPERQTGETRRDAEINALRGLAMPAPSDTFARFRRRAAVVQGTRMLFESQVVGFWVVLDAMLRMFLGKRPAAAKITPRSAIQGEQA